MIGVILALIIVVSVSSGGSDSPLAIKLANWATAAEWLGLAAFLACVIVFAQRIMSGSRQK
jgi:OPT family oligopeptide transporter